VYAKLLGEKIKVHQVQVWLVNTGWTGGPFGVGKRINLPDTRAMIRAVLTGELNEVPMRTDSNFGLSVPVECPAVSMRVLNPRQTWANPDEYDRQAQKLAVQFQENFVQYRDYVSPGVIAAGPLIK
jgi:phosphoenolpyruvate carboxykinase (ATP)